MKPKKSPPPVPPGGEIILYQTEDGQTRIQCRFEDEAIWLTQKLMAELFQVSVPTVNEHLKAIYAEGELSAEATIRNFRIVQTEGTRQVERLVDHYHLNAIPAVGFRVRSQRGTQFRQWAITRLEEYLRKGFTMDDERLKHPPSLGIPDYFDELLERIRDIRASEKRVYLQVRHILALAAGYDPRDAEAQVFFQTVQNKLHFGHDGRGGSRYWGGDCHWPGHRTRSHQPDDFGSADPGHAADPADEPLRQNSLHRHRGPGGVDVVRGLVAA